VLEVRYDLDGLPVTFIDTAGLRSTTDALEAAGVARARDRAATADVRLLLTAPDAPLTPEIAALGRERDLLVATKADLGPADGTLAVSAATGEGLPALLSAVASRLPEVGGDGGLVAHERQRAALVEGREALLHALSGLDRKGAEEVSEDIRGALRALERLLGRVGVEDLLDEIFARFCLGK